MGSYRNISMSFWTDTKVEDDFTPEDKYIYLYVLTNPHTNLCGCYEISTKQVAHETGYNTDSAERLLKRLDQVHNVIRYNAPTKELLVLNWAQYNWTASVKLNKPLLEEIKKIKHKDFQKYLADLFNERENIATPYDPDADQPEPKIVRHKYGEFGWVRLSDDEYARLLASLGEEELQRCITYVDESAQKNHNRNKWTDWNLVIRHCHRDAWYKNRKTGQSQSKSSSASAMEDLQRIHQMFEEAEQ